ncbi:hypothetical protein F7725_006385 [Dissostichus mawsoni]|uniref:Uncharacterized protein n=1 Tax=Dissostichus mawsoni TaxID=36200 RepID=A0A7J5XUQ7_DISMA|nr:hypothetical protein F7725_006385 [Dissostichus mawsoni]
MMTLVMSPRGSPPSPPEGSSPGRVFVRCCATKTNQSEPIFYLWSLRVQGEFPGGVDQALGFTAASGNL